MRREPMSGRLAKSRGVTYASAHYRSLIIHGFTEVADFGVEFNSVDSNQLKSEFLKLDSFIQFLQIIHLVTFHSFLFKSVEIGIFEM